MGGAVNVKREKSSLAASLYTKQNIMLPTFLQRIVIDTLDELDERPGMLTFGILLMMAALILGYALYYAANV